MVKKIFGIILLLPLLAITGSLASAQENTLAEVGKNAAQAYVYGYPLVLMNETRKITVGDQFNRIKHTRTFPDHTFRRVVRINLDTLYSTIWLDLSGGPVVIGLPDSEGRYYVMPIHDSWTNVIASIGSRTTGHAAHKVLVAGPEWQGTVPDGMTLVRSPTTIAWAIGRIETPGGDDMAGAHAFQDGMTVQTLAAFHAGGPVNAPLYATADENTNNPKVAADAYRPLALFAELADLLAVNGPLAADGPMVDGPLKALGIIPGQPFDKSAWSPVQEQAMGAGIKRAQQAMLGVRDKVKKSPTFWSGMPGGVRLGAYGTRYPLRAYVARVGLGANEPEDAVYPNTLQDASGNPLYSNKRYRIRFPSGELPPVNAFWSLTLYNETFYLAKNPINRHALGGRNGLAVNADGSVDIYIQADEPEGVALSNWLPAPNPEASATFALNMRLYWPKDRVLDGSWKMPGVEVVE